MKSNFQLLRQWDLICRLMGGRMLRLEDFDDIRRKWAVGPKTLQRDLQCVLDIPYFEIVQIRHNGETCYRMYGRMVPTKPKPISRRCYKCGVLKLISEFFTDRSRPDGFKRKCKACCHVVQRRWRQRNPKLVNAQRRRFYHRHKDAINERRRERYQNSLRADGLRAKARAYYRRNKETIRARQNARKRELRRENAKLAEIQNLS